MTQAQNNAFPYITVAETSVPANPSAGNQRLYIDPADHKLKVVNSSGTVTTVDASAITAILSTFALPGDISPTQITADQNDYNPTSLSTASVLRLSSDAARNITGLQGGADGRVLIIHNVGSYAITLKDESVSSTAANRFALSADVAIAADVSVMIQYDSTSSRWRLLGGTGSGSGATLQTNASRVLIAEISPTGTGTASFTSIPSGYDGLLVEYAIRSTQAATSVNLNLQINGDTTAGNYRGQEFGAYGATSFANAFTTYTMFSGVCGANSPTSEFTVGNCQVIQYLNTSINKQVIGSAAHKRDVSSLYEVFYNYTLNWMNTAAVNRLDFILSAGNYATGSVIRLYGIKASPVPATTTLLNSRKLIATALPSGTGTVTFSSIPSTYKDLEIVIVGRGTQAAAFTAVNLAFNGDTTDANYRYSYVQGFGVSSGGGVGGDGRIVTHVSAASAPTNSASVSRISILNYRGTTFNKYAMTQMTQRYDNSSVYENTANYGVEWESNVAITQIDLVLASGNFVAGSEIRLYGVYEADGAELSVQTTAGPLAYTAITGGDYSGLTSTSGADLDATNAKVTFTAPASGKVLVRLTASCHSGIVAAYDYLMWGLREDSSDIAGYPTVIRGWAAAATSRPNACSFSFVITGLTPNSAHTYKWAYKVNTSASAVLYASTSAPAVMEVWPLP